MKATQRPTPPDYPAAEAAIRRALRPLSVAQQQLLLAQITREVSHG
ncbi:MAG: hypothetical protein AAFN08_11500 [Cyanobacteria bacterium J06559_3]